MTKEESVARFFDDIIRSRSVPWPQLMELLEKSTVILADNVAEYYYSGTDQDYWSLEDDFPNLAPPFEVFFVEWKDPPFLVTRASGRQDLPMRKRTGALFTCTEASTIGNQGPGSDCRWVETIWVWTEFGNKIDCVGSVRIKVGQDGRTVRFSDKGYFAATINPDLNPQPKVEYMLSFVQPALLTVCFLHCKNVTMQTHVPPPALAKKIRLRYGRPPITYKTLVIEPLKQILKTEGNSGSVGLRKALHICRGHFKDYRQHGLFGKLHGVYWWSDHVAGTLNSGLVKKDYSVLPPKADKPGR